MSTRVQPRSRAIWTHNGSDHLRAYVSLWSADLLALRDAVDLIGDDADGLHIDVFDAHDVDELLFGPDVVAALRAHTDAFLDVHLNVTDPELWARRFIAAGADMITVPVGACPAAGTMLAMIQVLGAGVVPGSLVFGEPDPVSALSWIRHSRHDDGRTP